MGSMALKLGIETDFWNTLALGGWLAIFAVQVSLLNVCSQPLPSILGDEEIATSCH